jgi:hypothetical protein
MWHRMVINKPFKSGLKDTISMYSDFETFEGEKSEWVPNLSYFLEQFFQSEAWNVTSTSCEPIIYFVALKSFKICVHNWTKYIL